MTERQAITVRGIVQGVGFRPFVYGLAHRLQLNGFVRNQAGWVLIEIEGRRQSLRRFLDQLQSHPPPLSRIDEVACESIPRRDEAGFRIEESRPDPSGQVFISPDVATCADCLAELFDPADRRYGYPFLNCTNCGPRLTIIEGAPYDRQRTTMARFAMCPNCQAEYDDPGNRRFHAQPTACPRCGPQLEAREANGERIATDDPLSYVAGALRQGQIAALKGLGGFHLVCDAGNERAVSELRRRKHREEKPLAVMVRDVEAAQALCRVDAHERELLESPRRPIVLLQKRHALGAGTAGDTSSTATTKASPVAEAVAPGNPYLGVMLPYTPLHHLLMRAVGDAVLVMTSGNRTDEPIAYENDDAQARLGEIADIFLMHDRPIHVRCDDSVTRSLDGDELPLRRSRGYAPQPIRLPLECPGPTLAVGGQLKGVFALGCGHRAFLSHHLGDLDHLEAYRALVRDVDLYQDLFEVRPEYIACDLHPDYASTSYARRRAAEEGLQLVGVQHHHAHLASCMAEHGLAEPVIGVSFDGTGYGTDGAIWGGEFLVGDYAQFTRAAHLRYVPLPGGDAAVREPWRIALSHLLDAGCGDACLHDVSARQRRAVEQMIERVFNSPLTSSAGRLFDAVAAIAGARSRASYEAQAALELEWLATETPADGTYPFELTDNSECATRSASVSQFAGSPGGRPPASSAGEMAGQIGTTLSIDTRPLIRAVAGDAHRGVAAGVIARRFHSTLVEIIAAVCGRIRQQTGLEAVVLSGGVFLNVLLARETCARLRAEGFRVYRHRLVPPGDGGLSLGQLAVAAARLAGPADTAEVTSTAAPVACVR